MSEPICWTLCRAGVSPAAIQTGRPHDKSEIAVQMRRVAPRHALVMRNAWSARPARGVERPPTGSTKGGAFS